MVKRHRRIVSIVTTARSDYGIYTPLLRRIAGSSDLDLQLIVTGMHLVPEFGGTIKEIEKDNFPIAAKIETIISSDDPQGTAKSIGNTTFSFAQYFSHNRPDILVLLGDRFEMFAVGAAAVPFLIPVAHIGGGAVTEGSIDDSFRHALTKFSHLHFVETELYRKRIIRMGEEPSRVILTGALSLDNLKEVKRLTLDEVNKEFDLKIKSPFLLVTFHPVTRELEHISFQIESLFKGLSVWDHHIVFSYPNADPTGQFILKCLKDYQKLRGEKVTLVENLGLQANFSLMSCAKALVGNSSSGLVEAPSFQLPTVNIGSRQSGRVKGVNVIDVSCQTQDIAKGITKATSESFVKSLEGMINPYGEGGAADIILNYLRQVPLDATLIRKRFYEDA